MDKHITAPLQEDEIRELRAGDYVFITGTIYTARDAAHKRMKEALEAGESLPFDVNGNVIYYMGPSPAREGRRSVPQALRRQAVWTAMRRNCWILV